MIVVVKKGSNKRLGNWSYSNMFDCKCSKCKSTLIHVRTIGAYDTVCDLVGSSVIIVESFKCQERNEEVFDGYDSSSLYGGTIILECPSDFNYAKFKRICLNVFPKIEEIELSNKIICNAVRI